MTELAVPSLALSCPLSLLLDDRLNVSTSASHFVTDHLLLLVTDYRLTPHASPPTMSSVQHYHQSLLDSLSFPFSHSPSFGIAASCPRRLRTHELGLYLQCYRNEVRGWVFLPTRREKTGNCMGVLCYLQPNSPSVPYSTYQGPGSEDKLKAGEKRLMKEKCRRQDPHDANKGIMN